MEIKYAQFDGPTGHLDDFSYFCVGQVELTCSVTTRVRQFEALISDRDPNMIATNRENDMKPIAYFLQRRKLKY